jgi:PAS domain S-box-containing protein
MTRADRLRLWAAWGGPAFAVGLGALAADLTSRHQSARALSAVVFLLFGWSFAAAGLAALTRRPENNSGRLLVWTGIALLLGVLSAANDRVVYTVGTALDAVVLAAFVHLLLAFPEGVLRRRREQVAVGCSYALALTANVAILLFDAHPDCTRCAPNVILVAEHRRLADAISVVVDVLAAALLLWALWLLVERWRASSTVVRRALRPVGLTGGPTLFFLLLGFAVQPVSNGVGSVLKVLGFGTVALVPFAFLAGLLRGRYAPGSVARRLVSVPETATLEETQAALRAALGDPELRLGAWVPERGAYVDVEGRPFQPRDAEARPVTRVASVDGTPLATIEHDRGLLAEHELLDSAVAAARLSLHRNRLQAELRARLDELQRERDFIADVVNAAPTFFCVLDLDGRIIRFNDPLTRSTGIEDDDRARGRLFWDVFAVPDDADGVRACILTVAPGELEHRWRSRDGGELVVAWSVIPITDGAGNARIVVSGLDVSERARHADEIRRERDFHARVGEATPTLLAVVHGDGTVDARGVNAAFSAVTGIADVEAIGRPFWELVAPPGREDEIRDTFAAAVDTGEPVRAEAEWGAADGGTIVVEWWTASLAAYRDDHWLVCANDITARKHDEDELRRSRSRLVAAGDAERRRLERNLHDGAQQRLVTMSLALRLVEQMLDRDPETAKSILAEASNELGQALQELRELARGLHPAVLSDRGLPAALEALAERATVPVELSVEIDGRLPPGVEVAIFYVVSEALANVAKYAQATAALVRVVEDGGTVDVAISDNGIGGADPARGSGLRGLVDRVAALDGRLEVDSPLGRGTTIRAVFPLGAGVRPPVPEDASLPHSV